MEVNDVHAEKYESNEVKLFVKNSTEESQSLAFLYPVMHGRILN